MEKELRVALVLTAGGLKEIWGKDGKRLPFWYHWSLFKKRVKERERRGEITVVYKEELKGETIARLKKALRLFQSGVVGLIICVGGYSPRRKRLGLKDSVAMMNEWLIAHGVDERFIVGGDATSVDTGTNMEEFIGRFKRVQLLRKPTIYLVTSWYHLFRAKVELYRALKKEKLEANIICAPAFPRLDAVTLKYEYASNLLMEILNLVSLLLPGIKSWWRKREHESRE